MKRYNHMFTLLGIMCVPFLPDSVGIPPLTCGEYQTTSSEIPNPKYFLFPLYWRRIWEWRLEWKRRCIWFTFHILLRPKTPWPDTFMPIQTRIVTTEATKGGLRTVMLVLVIVFGCSMFIFDLGMWGLKHVKIRLTKLFFSQKIFPPFSEMFFFALFQI